MSGSKHWYIYTMEYYAAEGKKELLPFAAVWDELESITLREISQAVKDKYHRMTPINGTSSTKPASVQNRTGDMEIKNKLTRTRGEGEMG